MAILDSITVALTAYDKLKEFTSKVKDAEALEQMAAVKIALAEIKIQAADLTTENDNLKRDLARLRKLPDIRKLLDFNQNSYVLKAECEGFPAGHRFCSRCFDVDGRLVSAHMGGPTQHVLKRPACPQCDRPTKA